ncbi:hypothetical protein Gotur_009613 [Gossypium turneri]
MVKDGCDCYTYQLHKVFNQVGIATDNEGLVFSWTPKEGIILPYPPQGFSHDLFVLFYIFLFQDIEMHRGKPLYLNEERYAALSYMVASHGLDRSSKVIGQTTIGAFFMV